jgi:transcriptional regulator with XRE-family HTH domain
MFRKKKPRIENAVTGRRPRLALQQTPQLLRSEFMLATSLNCHGSVIAEERYFMAKGRRNDYDLIIAENVRTARIARNISQTDLGKPLGVTFQQIQKYEKGINRISAGRLVAIADVLQLPVADLLAGTGKGQSSRERTPCELLAASREGNRLAAAFNDLEPRFRSLIVELVEGITGKLKAIGRKS